MRGFIEVIQNNRDYDKADYYISDDFAGVGGNVVGRDNFIQFLKNHGANVPDVHRDIEDMIAEGDKVAVFMKFGGTFSGVSNDSPAKGKYATWSVVIIFELKDGKIVSSEVKCSDYLTMNQQLGVIPPIQELGK